VPPSDCVDDWLSIVQMPAGVPVATLAIGNARNVRLVAAPLLVIGEAALSEFQATADPGTSDRECDVGDWNFPNVSLLPKPPATPVRPSAVQPTLKEKQECLEKTA